MVYHGPQLSLKPMPSKYASSCICSRVGYERGIICSVALDVQTTMQQCSEQSGDPTGDGGENTKRTGQAGRDGTISCGPV